GVRPQFAAPLPRLAGPAGVGQRSHYSPGGQEVPCRQGRGSGLNRRAPAPFRRVPMDVLRPAWSVVQAPITGRTSSVRGTEQCKACVGAAGASPETSPEPPRPEKVRFLLSGT